LSWVTDFWKILETVATLTKEVERGNSEIKELRRDVNALTLTVSQLKSDLTHEKETTKLILDNHQKDGQHLKESIDSKFDVLVTRLDSKIAAFENRLPITQPEKKSPRSLDSGLDD
jgi:predicted  nucleic acid-binding Zn-ribbon protein